MILFPEITGSLKQKADVLAARFLCLSLFLPEFSSQYEMAEKSLPPSPNWYLSLASDANEAGVYVYAARLNVYVLDVSFPSAGPRMIRCYMEHTERVTSVALSPDGDAASPALPQPASWADESEAVAGNDFGAGVLCCSGGDDKYVRIWAVDTLSDVQSHNEHKV